MRRLLVFLLAALVLAGCGRGEEEKLQDLEFSVVAERDVPEELAKVIGEKKGQAFQLTYRTPEELYLAVGYGAQATGGYSIRVLEFYLTGEAMVLDTELLGPESAEGERGDPSYPYLVIKTGGREEPVIFR